MRPVAAATARFIAVCPYCSFVLFKAVSPCCGWLRVLGSVFGGAVRSIFKGSIAVFGTFLAAASCG